MGAILISTELLVAAFVCGIAYSGLSWSSRQLTYASSPEVSSQRLRLWRQNLRGITLMLFGLALVAILGFNGWLLYRGQDVLEQTQGLVQRIPSDFWLGFAVGSLKCVALLAAIAFALRFIRPRIKRLSYWLQNLDDIEQNDISIARFFLASDRLIRVGMWLLGLVGCLKLLNLSDFLVQYLYVALSIYLTVSAGFLVLNGVAIFLDSLDGLSRKYSSEQGSIFQMYEQVKSLLPFLRRCLEYAVWVCVATLVVGQVEVVSNWASYGPMIVKVIAIVSISRILTEVSQLFLEKVFLGSYTLDDVKGQQRGTMLPLMVSIVRYIVYFAAGMFALKTIGFDPAPILAGAGIVGLTIGLGAQSMVKDIVSGFFILFEDCYLVGDFIETDDALGVVDSIQLRTTRVLHPNGQMQILRNGDIGSITNYSRRPIDAVVKASISYEADPAQACEVIRRVGEALCASDEHVLEPTRIEGIEPFGECTLHIFTRTKVVPGKHLRVKRLLRQQILEAFMAEDVEMVPMDTKLMLKGGKVAFSDGTEALLSLI